MSSSIRVPVEDLWRRAQAVRIASMPCLTLSWEHMLLHLTIHMADQNRFLGSLRGFCDVAEIVRRFPGGIDWDELVRMARAWGALRQLMFALSLAREAVGAAVPPQVLRKLRRQVTLLPFEEGLLRFLCLRAAVIFEASQHVVYDWISWMSSRASSRTSRVLKCMADVAAASSDGPWVAWCWGQGHSR